MPDAYDISRAKRISALSKRVRTFTPSEAFRQISSAATQVLQKTEHDVYELSPWKQTMWGQISGAGLAEGIFPTECFDDDGFLHVDLPGAEKYRVLFEWLQREPEDSRIMEMVPRFFHQAYLGHPENYELFFRTIEPDSYTRRAAYKPPPGYKPKQRPLTVPDTTTSPTADETSDDWILVPADASAEAESKDKANERQQQPAVPDNIRPGLVVKYTKDAGFYPMVRGVRTVHRDDLDDFEALHEDTATQAGSIQNGYADSLEGFRRCYEGKRDWTEMFSKRY